MPEIQRNIRYGISSQGACTLTEKDRIVTEKQKTKQKQKQQLHKEAYENSHVIVSLPAPLPIAVRLILLKHFCFHYPLLKTSEVPHCL